MYQKLLLATGNQGKVTELRSLLRHLATEVLSLDQIGVELLVEENGATYEENARKKALAAARLSGIPSVGDDSGIEIKGLGWQPGLLSARYYEGTWTERLTKLLASLRDSDREGREARFICVMTLAEGNEIIGVGRGIMRCRIAEAPSGDSGFGYDPVVVPDGYDITLGEMSSYLKNRIGHRALAARDLTAQLSEIK